MKKRITAIFMVLLMTIILCTPALATNGIMEYVIDPDDLLSYDEWDALENKAAEISQRYDCGVYVQFVYDYADYDYLSAYKMAESLYYDYDFGMGDGMDGIMLLVSYYTRDYAIYTYGDTAQDTFDLDAVEDSFLQYLRDDDWYGGFDAYLAACDEELSGAETIAPTEPDTSDKADTSAEPDASDEPDTSDEPSSPVGGILTSVGISCIVALIICLVLKGKMKSVHRKVEAKQYTANGGLQLTETYDRYTHTTETVRTVENKSSGSSSGGGGSGGKF